MRLAGALLLSTVFGSAIGGYGHRNLTDPTVAVTKIELFTGAVTAHPAGSRVTFTVSTPESSDFELNANPGPSDQLVSTDDGLDTTSVSTFERTIETSSIDDFPAGTTYYFTVESANAGYLRIDDLPTQPRTYTYHLEDPNTSPHTIFDVTGFQVSSGDYLTWTKSGAAKTVFLKVTNSITPFTGGDGHTHYHVNTAWVATRHDYNVTTNSLTAVAIDSRKSFGQPNKEGELPGIDPNAPSRNIGFQGWTYKGGLFVGRTAGTSDLSGSARIQLYGTGTFTSPALACIALIDLGSPTTFTEAVNLRAVQPVDSTNSTVLSSAVKWDTKWTAPTLNSTDNTLELSGARSDDYVNVQYLGSMDHIILALGNEAGASGWRYFGSEDYKSELATASLTDGLASYGGPKLGVIDTTFSSSFSYSWNHDEDES